MNGQANKTAKGHNMKLGKNKVQIFKMKNRKGFAAICSRHLTEGRTAKQACERMEKALKRKKKRG